MDSSNIYGWKINAIKWKVKSRSLLEGRNLLPNQDARFTKDTSRRKSLKGRNQHQIIKASISAQIASRRIDWAKIPW
ncbi:hypothetical protein HAX54_037675, partial [Datura stramonium]|nr:hypothetical protein [Datura stramonium]